MADVDSDGDLDVVIARGAYSLTWNGGISIFLNNGTGSLTDDMKIDATSDALFDYLNPYGAAIADFNGDGKPDLAFSNYSTDVNAIVIALRTSADGAPPIYSRASPRLPASSTPASGRTT